MRDLAPLPALLERIKAATGVDRELDAAIWNALPDPDYPSHAYCETNCVTLANLGRNPRYHDGWLIRRSPDDQYSEDLPLLTALVAAVEQDNG